MKNRYVGLIIGLVLAILIFSLSKIGIISGSVSTLFNLLNLSLASKIGEIFEYSLMDKTAILVIGFITQTITYLLIGFFSGSLYEFGVRKNKILAWILALILPIIYIIINLIFA
ncbi:MAG: hypothetical protein AABX30_02775 [Nanoarchaeota archaeon]